MKKKQHKKLPTFENVFLSEFLAFLFALGYMQSVLTVANHVSMWVHDGTEHTVPAPDLFTLVAAVLLLGFAFYKRGGKLTTFAVISLTILVTSSIFWLSGLRTNFYF